MICIFCLCEKDDQHAIEHIIPESLGGGDWAVLPPEIVCDSCNHYFGSKIESKVLQDYPFNLLRLFSGVVTKKRKWATLNHSMGTLRASPYEHVIGLDPSSPEMEELILSGKKTQFRVIAETRFPLLMCRFLLKIAMEQKACESVLDAFTHKYSNARRFSRNPRIGDKWWFMYHHELELNRQSNRETKVEIVDIGSAEMAWITILGCHFFVPLDPRIVYEANSEMREPEYRYFFVQQSHSRST